MVQCFPQTDSVNVAGTAAQWGRYIEYIDYPVSIGYFSFSIAIPFRFLFPTNTCAPGLRLHNAQACSASPLSVFLFVSALLTFSY